MIAVRKVLIESKQALGIAQLAVSVGSRKKPVTSELIGRSFAGCGVPLVCSAQPSWSIPASFLSILPAFLKDAR